MDMEQIKEINYWHVKGVDKYYRMFAGLSSEFIDLLDDTLYLKIHISPQWNINPHITAKKLAVSWVKNNPQLTRVKRYHVTIINIDGETGFAINPKAMEDTIDVQILLNRFEQGDQEMKTSKEGLVIEGIFNN